MLGCNALQWNAIGLFYVHLTVCLLARFAFNCYTIHNSIQYNIQCTQHSRLYHGDRSPGPEIRRALRHGLPGGHPLGRPGQVPQGMASGRGGSLRERDRGQVPHHRRQGPVHQHEVRDDRSRNQRRPGPAANHPGRLYRQSGEQAHANPQLSGLRGAKHGRDRPVR